MTRIESEDKNMLIMDLKKDNKKKRMKQASGRMFKTENNHEPSKLLKRKLKKLEKDKKNDILLSESIRVLEKYKIHDDTYSLMWASSNLGRAETVREKRRREMRFCKAGLELPQSDRPFKRRVSNITINEPDTEDSLLGDTYIKNYGSQSILQETEMVQGNRVACFMQVNDVLIEKNDISTLADAPQESLLDREIKKSMDMIKNESSKVDISLATERGLSTPTVVHVLRPKELEEKRRDLPIVMMEQEIMEAIRENASIIICGETGCGKTTQVPQFLYEAGFSSEKSTIHRGIIGVTQPRRLAVLATAKRVAYELGLKLGIEVGFQVRHDRRVGDNCSIKFMTDGILLRELQNDFLLKRYSILVLDEVHERSLNTDILIGMLSRITQERQKIYEEQKRYEVASGKILEPEKKIMPLKLVLMSATLRVEDFVSGKRIFQVPPPIIEVPTRQYPVTVHFAKRTEIVDYVGQAYKKVLSIHKRLPPGGILVFVTGQREVEYMCKMLRKASTKMVEINCTTDINGSYDEFPEDGDSKEIDEAFEIQENSSFHQTDRFSSYDADYNELSEIESDSGLSYNSEDDSDFEASEVLEDTILADGNLDALKTSFQSLTGEASVAPTVDISNPNLKSMKGDVKNVIAGALCVLPLYAMLPASAQLRVFNEIKEGERLVVVATNVAETSLTIPGIKYVVDTGRQKVKNFNSSSGMETYEIEWISKASAAQRAGRAGRTGPGHCYRLYSSAVFNNIFIDFSSAEITKIPVDGVVLLMKSMGISKVVNFPFPTSPGATALIEAERCLRTLQALDRDGSLTPLGKSMARYPMSPRHARMILTVIQIMKKGKVAHVRPNLVLGYAVAAAAALSLSSPIIFQFEKDGDGDDDDNHVEKKKKKLKENVKALRAKFSNPSSDALTVAYALQCFEQAENHTEFCNVYALHLKTMEEMSKLRKQLLDIVFNQSRISDDLQNHEFSWVYGSMEDVRSEWRVSFDKSPLLSGEEELLGQAICAGWADRVAKRIKGHSSNGHRQVNAVRYQACMVKETVFLHHSSSVSRFSPEFLVYSELLHSKRPYIHRATSVKPDWMVKYGRSLCTFSAPLADPKPYYEPVNDKILCWVSPYFGPHLWLLPPHSFPVEDDMQRVAVFASSLLDGRVLPCFSSVKKFLSASPASILRAESSGHRRVGSLLFKLRMLDVDSYGVLRQVWRENPAELFSEIKEWFQEGFHHEFEELWLKMHSEIAELAPDNLEL